jgi:methylaspartate ammonia-lyase
VSSETPQVIQNIPVFLQVPERENVIVDILSLKIVDVIEESTYRPAI